MIKEDWIRQYEGSYFFFITRRPDMAKITKKELIDLLNKDLALEYTAIVQYTQHQGALKGAMYQSIQKELIIHS